MAKLKTLKLGKFEPLTFFEIWSPRWHDRTVLLKASKVKDATTRYIKVKFTKANSLPDDYVITKAKVLTYPKETNGTIVCYAVPLNEFKLLEVDEKDVRQFI